MKLCILIWVLKQICLGRALKLSKPEITAAWSGGIWPKQVSVLRESEKKIGQLFSSSFPPNTAKSFLRNLQFKLIVLTVSLWSWFWFLEKYINDLQLHCVDLKGSGISWCLLVLGKPNPDPVQWDVTFSLLLRCQHLSSHINAVIN